MEQVLKKIKYIYWLAIGLHESNSINHKRKSSLEIHDSFQKINYKISERSELPCDSKKGIWHIIKIITVRLIPGDLDSNIAKCDYRSYL